MNFQQPRSIVRCCTGEGTRPLTAQTSRHSTSAHVSVSEKSYATECVASSLAAEQNGNNGLEHEMRQFNSRLTTPGPHSLIHRPHTLDQVSFLMGGLAVMLTTAATIMPRMAMTEENNIKTSWGVYRKAEVRCSAAALRALCPSTPQPPLHDLACTHCTLTTTATQHPIIHRTWMR
jgi:hypothetical protein